MGKETPSWEYVQTAEDWKRLAFFRSIFEQNALALKGNLPNKHTIPSTFHFIWLGPDPFPKESKDRIAHWIELHPGAEFKFWTDVEQELPHPLMQKCLIQEFPFQYLEHPFYDATHNEEKSKILAYEILFREGGIYIDHNSFPFQSLTALNDQFDFYCGLEKLGPTLMSSSILPSTHLIAAKPKHPVLEETLLWLQSHWDQYGKFYPGKSLLELKNRIRHRTFWAFAEGIERKIGQEGNRDIILPVSYFNELHRKATSFVLPNIDQALSQPLTHFEQKMEKKFSELIHKDDEAVLITIILAGISFLGWFILFFYARNIVRRKT